MKSILLIDDPILLNTMTKSLNTILAVQIKTEIETKLKLDSLFSFFSSSPDPFTAPSSSASFNPV